MMRIAIPLNGGHLAPHFGHCERFALFDVDPETKEIIGSTEVAAPEHQPGLLPKWLKEHGVAVVIAGGMGSRARNLFDAVSIQVITGAPEAGASTLVRGYLDGSLTSGPNVCGH